MLFLLGLYNTIVYSFDLSRDVMLFHPYTLTSCSIRDFLSPLEFVFNLEEYYMISRELMWSRVGVELLSLELVQTPRWEAYTILCCTQMM